jgi:hypothetical protein
MVLVLTLDALFNGNNSLYGRRTKVENPITQVVLPYDNPSLPYGWPK